ncbi:hypothetical protein F909_01888 [Acinetobacter sp. ANC 3929]|nr:MULTISPECIES: ADP-ribosylglycohydrolase family protein [unclassified Acinetobacter]ENW80602.1 hypothetical protein F909_01888 [Acinetobacter sp. ANC 3929]
MIENKIRGGLYGLLIGDAVGVPYEFNPPDLLPSYHEIDMIPPQGFRKTYPEIPVGTWSDDGAQSLCLLASLLYCGKYEELDFANRLCNWFQYGYMAIDYEVFDVGVQTAQALRRYKEGGEISQIANRDEYSNGNGALMRTLPLALWHKGSDEQLIQDAYAQSHLTHAHIRSKICSALYCLWARYLLSGNDVNEAWDKSVKKLNLVYKNRTEELKEFQEHISPIPEELTGSGYVVDCLHSARFSLQQTTFEDVIKTAVKLGQDTDTTACVAGGLAGIIYGYDELPKTWLKLLKGKEIVEPLLLSLEQHLRVNH